MDYILIARDGGEFSTYVRPEFDEGRGEQHKEEDISFFTRKIVHLVFERDDNFDL